MPEVKRAGGKPVESVSRLEDLKSKGQEPERVECVAGYLLAYFWEIGPVAGGGMSSSAITHAEIQAWQQNAGVELNSWEARMMRSLSAAYLGEIQAAKVPDCPCPILVEMHEERRAQVKANLRSFLRGL